MDFDIKTLIYIALDRYHDRIVYDKCRVCTALFKWLWRETSAVLSALEQGLANDDRIGSQFFFQPSLSSLATIAAPEGQPGSRAMIKTELLQSIHKMLHAGMTDGLIGHRYLGVRM
jgi:hypothetical protein